MYQTMREFIVIWLGILICMTCPSYSQIFAFGDTDEPFTIHADETLEWHQDLKAYVARKNVRIQRGDTTLRADVLVAYYRQSESHTDTLTIERIIGEGQVTLTLPKYIIHAQRAEYDITKAILLLTGDNLRWVAIDDDLVITARDSLEFYEHEGLAVARGNTKTILGDRRMRADVLISQFVQGDGGQLILQRIDGQQNVLITTSTLILRCDNVIYSVEANRGVLLGNVHLTQGENQINGERAEIDFNTNTSRMVSIDQPILGRIVHSR